MATWHSKTRRYLLSHCCLICERRSVTSIIQVNFRGTDFCLPIGKRYLHSYISLWATFYHYFRYCNFDSTLLKSVPCGTYFGIILTLDAWLNCPLYFENACLLENGSKFLNYFMLKCWMEISISSKLPFINLIYPLETSAIIIPVY